jgi:hypothetical protein
MIYIFAECALDVQCRDIHRTGRVIRLQPKVFQALSYQLTYRDRAVSKTERGIIAAAGCRDLCGVPHHRSESSLPAELACAPCRGDLSRSH